MNSTGTQPFSSLERAIELAGLGFSLILGAEAVNAFRKAAKAADNLKNDLMDQITEHS